MFLIALWSLASLALGLACVACVVAYFKYQAHQTSIVLLGLVLASSASYCGQQALSRADSPSSAAAPQPRVGQSQETLTIPDDRNRCHFLIADSRQGDHSTHEYVIITYGRENGVNQPDGSRHEIMVGDQPVIVPGGTGDVLVLDSSLRFHKAPFTANDLLGGAFRTPAFLDSSLWRDQLYPLLKKHTWTGEGAQANR